MKTVNTVLGPLDTSKIGFALMHDHIVASIGGLPQIYPELLGKDYKERIVKGLVAARQDGVNTVVDADPMNLGRDVRILAEVSRISGVNIICCSGWYRGFASFPWHIQRRPDFAQIFAREVREGIEGANIKAGILKSAADFEGVTPSIELVLRGVARAHFDDRGADNVTFLLSGTGRQTTITDSKTRRCGFTAG